MWVALYIGLFWLALSILTGALWGLARALGWSGPVVLRDLPFEEYGDLTEGR